MGLELSGDVGGLRTRHLLEEDVPQMLVAVELVHTSHVGLLGLSQLLPCILAYHVTRLLRDHRSEQSLGLAGAIACV